MSPQACGIKDQSQKFLAISVTAGKMASMERQPVPAQCDENTAHVRVPRILLAEDDPAIRDVLGHMLRRMNYRLDFAEDGLRAVEMWEKGGYDLVLMDVQMPRLDGLEATRAIREMEMERGGHTPIVAMTAHSRKEDAERCRAAGMDSHISKPIDFEKSLQVIGAIITQSPTVVSEMQGSPSKFD